MPDSPHSARWVNLLLDENWEIMVFPVSSQPVSIEFDKSINIYQHSILLRIAKFLLKINDHIGVAIIKATSIPFKSKLIKINIFISRIGRSLLALLDDVYVESIANTKITIPKLHGSDQLLKCIEDFKPDLVHSLEIQHCSYLLLEVKSNLGNKFPKWAVTNWGSDIYYFKKFDTHFNLLSKVLENTNYYFCECHRDVELAFQMGFQGEVAPVGPNIGGFNLEMLKPIRDVLLPSNRKVIVVKGYEGFSGKALIALEALSKCREYLSSFTVQVYSASPAVRDKIKELKKDGIDIQSLDRLTNLQLLNIFALARIYLGVGVTDGISTSMLEAMSMGAFPIQTNTACCDEWLEDGISGFIISPDDLEEMSARIRIALRDDALVDQASKINWAIAERRLDLSKNRKRIINFYSKILNAV